MKTCPRCSQVYTDETFDFCLEDGTPLSASLDSEATIIDPQPIIIDPQAIVKRPLTPDDYPPAVVTVPRIEAPTEVFQSEDPSQKLLNHLTDESQKFSLIGRFHYNYEFIWTNGHFFEIAESIPSVLIEAFPLRENPGPAELVKSLQTQLTTYTKARRIIPSKKEGMTDLVSDQHTIRVNNVYYQYLQMRYPEGSVRLGPSAYNPALFILNNKLRAGIMGVRI